MLTLTLFSTVFAADLPDLANTTSRKTCNIPPQHSGPHPGAEAFFTGAFVLSEDGTIKGEERRYLYGNAKWKATPKGEDCIDVWQVRGTKGTVTPVDDKHEGACKDCEFGIDLTGEIDHPKSTCKARMSTEANRYTVHYDVKKTGDGFILYFPSGKKLGEGKVDGTTYSWLSEQTCMWF